MKPMSIENLRELAKLNMDEKGFQIYRSLIEPNVKSMIQKSFGGWPSIESSVLQIMMRVNDVYKTDTSVIFDKGDEREKYSDLVDLEKYQKYEKYSFKQKIDNLLENKTIGENTHKLLDYLRLKRNDVIHGIDTYFTDEDREWFEIGYSVIMGIYFATSLKIGVTEQTQMINHAEESSTQIIKKIINGEKHEK